LAKLTGLAERQTASFSRHSSHVVNHWLKTDFRALRTASIHLPVET